MATTGIGLAVLMTNDQGAVVSVAAAAAMGATPGSAGLLARCDLDGIVMTE